uniref:Resistin n=1 Tax=Rhinopithecus roxellana TaxID=61622 RepID=A0A2K6Q793_RHIRO
MKALCLLLFPVLGLLVSSKTLCSMEEAISEKIQESASSLGSWDVRAETTCHCQCAGMDWTGARCCRLQP